MPNAAYHDRAHERVPQLMRYHRSGERIEFRPCPLRPEVELWPFEGPYATTWLAARGDTVQVCALPWTPITQVGHRYMIAQFTGCALAAIDRWPR